MFNLRVQVFIAFVSFSVLLALGLFFYSRFSFEQSFSQYMEQKEASRNARLISALAAHYEVWGSWSDLAKQDNWDGFVMQYQRFGRMPGPGDYLPGKNLPEDNQARDHQARDHESRDHEARDNQAQDGRPNDSPPPERELHPGGKGDQHRPLEFKMTFEVGRFPHMRDPRLLFVLLDSKQQLVAGERLAQEPYLYSKIFASINHQRVLVGYLGSPINPALRDLFDNEFVKRQQNHFLMMTLVGVIIAAICAIPLSHLLTQRVKALVRHVQQLSLGRYSERVSTRGQDEIATLGEHLNHLSHTLEQSEQTRKRWVADISHELRTPLAVLKADLEALEDGVRKFDDKAVGRLQKHAARLTRLVNDLYELSLTDIGALSYRKQDCELNELLTDLNHSIEGKFTQTGLQFSHNICSEPLVILADPQRLQQLLLNLINNSINYTNSPGEVHLNLRKEGDQALIELEDSAPGVDESLHEKLFERLYRAESSRSRETGGAGLGLSICKNIVEAHQGQIHIANSRLGGLKVSIHLPLLQE